MLARSSALILAALAVGCSDAEAPEDTVDASLADVVLVGDATQAALQAVISASPIADQARAAVIDSPSADALLPPSPKSTFAWHAAGMPPAGSPGGTMNGAGYFLVFATDRDPKVLRVLTSLTSYEPDDVAWEKLTAVGEWTSLSIESAVLTDDRVSEGPYASPLLLFCIER